MFFLIHPGNILEDYGYSERSKKRNRHKFVFLGAMQDLLTQLFTEKTQLNLDFLIEKKKVKILFFKRFQKKHFGKLCSKTLFF